MAQETTIEAGRSKLPPSQGVFAGGVWAGIIAGIIMFLFMMLDSLAHKTGFWMPLRWVAATFMGVDALVKTPAVALLGAFLHFCVAAFWGIIFASIVRRRATRMGAFWGGLLYGIAVWAVMTGVVLPSVDATMQARVAQTPGAWFVAHLLYGACLLVTPALKERFAETPVLPATAPTPRSRVGFSS